MSDEGDAGDEGTADEVEATPPGGPSRTVLIAVGLVVGLLLGAGLGWWGSRSDGDDDVADPGDDVVDDAPVESEAAAVALVEAWSRGRTSTFLSGSLLVRTTTGGATLEIPLVVAQRPPDRVISTGASVSGVVDDSLWVCDEQLDGLLRCQETESTADHDAEVARELSILRGYVGGELPLYRVAQDGLCFDLRLARAVQSPPYGERARFCFDEATGAPSLQRVERAEGIDEVTLVSVRAEVTDDDLARVASGDVSADMFDDPAAD